MADVSYDAGYHEYVVPADVTKIQVELQAAGGGSIPPLPPIFGADGGSGGYVRGDIDVTPGETLYFFVGSAALSGASNAAGGAFPGWDNTTVTWGGGRVDNTGATSTIPSGGATFFCRGTPDRSGIVALCGGGGGAGEERKVDGTTLSCPGGGGGSPGTVYQMQGAASTGVRQGTGIAHPTGGTALAGGQGGTDPGGNGENGDVAGLGIGGSGVAADGSGWHCGMGGGGWHGGGGGAWGGQGGAGGSAYTDGSMTIVETLPGSGRYPYVGISFATITVLNRPPVAPTLTAPGDAASVDNSVYLGLSWTFNDPDAGDSQGSATIRHRKAGSSDAWIETYHSGAETTHNFQPGSFDGVVEWQVSTTDSFGLSGPYSATRTFTVEANGVVPVITYPVEDQFIRLTTDLLTWTVDSQIAAQTQMLGDNAGSPDYDDVIAYSNVVFSETQRSGGVPYGIYGVNHRTVHVGLRTAEAYGKWSPWVFVRVIVDFTGPVTPKFTAVKNDDKMNILVQINNPYTTQPNIPSVHHNELWIDDGDGKGWVRRATDLLPNASWMYWTPRTKWNYDQHIKVVAVGWNGATSEKIGPG